MCLDAPAVLSTRRLGARTKLGASFGENPNLDFEIQKRILRFLGKSKNGSWIYKIHTQGVFFGSNPNPDFLDS